jgi:hypothetical protein
MTALLPFASRPTNNVLVTAISRIRNMISRHILGVLQLLGQVRDSRFGEDRLHNFLEPLC